MGIGIVLILITSMLVFAVLSFTISDYISEQSIINKINRDNIIENKSRFEEDIRKYYSANYDYLHLKQNLFPKHISLGGRNINLISWENIDESVLDQFVENYSDRKGNPYLFSKNRVCIPDENGDGKYNCEYYRQECMFDNLYDKNCQKSIQKQNLYHTIRANDYSKESMKNLMQMLPDGLFVGFKITQLDYLYNKFPVLSLIVYQGDDKFNPNLNSSRIIKFEDIINDKIFQAKKIMDKIYEQYGENVKRRWKGLTKVESVNKGNPFSTYGDAIKIGSKIGKNQYKIIGDNIQNGFSTSAYFVSSMIRIDEDVANKFKRFGCEIFDINDKSKHSTLKYPYITYDANLICKDTLKLKLNFCSPKNSCDAIKSSKYNKIKIDNFCLVGEPCFFEYTVKKDGVLNTVKTKTVYNAFKENYGIDLNSFINPFYPNSNVTLNKDIDGIGFILSSNNNGEIEVAEGLYKIIFGLKFIPTKQNSKIISKFKYKNYVLSTYSIENR